MDDPFDNEIDYDEIRFKPIPDPVSKYSLRPIPHKSTDSSKISEKPQIKKPGEGRGGRPTLHYEKTDE